MSEALFFSELPPSFFSECWFPSNFGSESWECSPLFLEMIPSFPFSPPPEVETILVFRWTDLLGKKVHFCFPFPPPPLLSLLRRIASRFSPSQRGSSVLFLFFQFKVLHPLLSKKIPSFSFSRKSSSPRVKGNLSFSPLCPIKWRLPSSRRQGKGTLPMISPPPQEINPFFSTQYDVSLFLQKEDSLSSL